MPEENPTLTFNHWKTGEQVTYTLSSGGGASTGEQLLERLHCPYDQTPLVLIRFVYGETDVRCPNCNTHYPSRSTQKEIDLYATVNINRRKQEAERLRAQAGQLEDFVKFAESAFAQTSPSRTETSQDPARARIIRGIAGTD